MIRDLIAYSNPKSQAAESYRTLRTNIQFSTLDNESNVIAITSCGPGEGKSTVISNLAITMAQSGKKVLLIDCDLRKPIIHKKFGISNLKGLTSLLIKDSKVEDVIQRVNINNLGVITSGPVPPNPSEILGSKNMKNLIEEFKKYFDVILLDAPPVLVVTDAQVISKVTDGMILLAAYGVTEKQALERAKDNIVKVNGKLLGVVMNKIPEKEGSYYGYGSYGDYYSDDSE
ncbi:CpsD/CapB family tyrosine-protein kinase [Clostridium hydrogeniformans]|uniref:CpsD/CapB family tyrosine-protein kinase n=1 Tax=Clostridium hydrogeniformans TaxID=349933 RepID=UPI0004893D14|nr:CpsD/CapB family tyrosine-protein kinase [Clostridium hydrogeniformans]